MILKPLYLVSRIKSVAAEVIIRAPSASVEAIPFPWRKFLYGYSLFPHNLPKRVLQRYRPHSYIDVQKKAI